MTSEANPHYFATNTKDDTSIDQITDAVDFPHTGLIKALSLGMKGNYAVKGSATDFDITQASTGNVLQVAAGKIYRDGAFLAVAAKNFTTGDFQATTNTHHLLVADSASPPVLQIRKHGSSTQNKIPPYTEGDTIIAVVTYTSDGFDDMTIQYLTTGKVANNVSIGYDSSGYNEAMSIEGSATRTLFKNKVADADIRFVLADNTADEKFEIYSDDDSDGDEGDTEVFSVDGTGATTISGAITVGGNIIKASDGGSTITMDTSDNVTIGGDLTVNGGDISFPNSANATISVAVTGGGTDGRDLTLEAGSAPTGSANQDGGDLILKAGGGDGTGTSIMTFSTKVNGTDAVAERMRIHTDGNVSIGTASPDANAKLTVEGAISLDEISAPTNTADRGQLYTNADNHLHFINGAGTDVKVTEEVFIVALSDETTDLTTGTGKASFHMPFAMTLTGVKANCTTAPVGATIIVDINEAGSTILSTKLSIDASELTSSTAASAAVMSDTALANDALITFDIDQVGSSTAGKGLKVTLYGYRA
jgi:hypothetical protein